MVKNDEFYTRCEDVVNELENYVRVDPDIFRGQCVYLPADCALYELSAFYRYFKENFHCFGLRKLICTHYNTFTDELGTKYGFCYTYEHTYTLKPSCRRFWAVQRPKRVTFTPSAQNGELPTLNTQLLEQRYTEHAYALWGDGDFRSEECKPFWEEADFIITNPPFSLFRTFYEYIYNYKKRFLIVGSQVASVYKDIFRDLWLGNIWYGATNLNTFYTPDGVKKLVSLWYTNLYHDTKPRPLPQLSTYEENKKRVQQTALAQRLYAHYDNYDAIEVSRIGLIPSDYTGRIGVPLTILKYILTPHKHPTPFPNAYNPETMPDTNAYGLVNSLPIYIERHTHGRMYRGVVINGFCYFTRIIITHNQQCSLIGKYANYNPIKMAGQYHA